MPTSAWIEKLVAEEIERQLKWFAESGQMATTTECATKVVDIYPACGLSHRELTDRVIAAAAVLKVPLHIDGGAKKK